MDTNEYCPLSAIITREMRYDQLTPILAYAAVGGVGACMLESAYDEGYGTYSFIGINPLATFTAFGREIKLEVNGSVTHLVDDPYVVLPKFVANRRAFRLWERRESIPGDRKSASNV